MGGGEGDNIQTLIHCSHNYFHNLSSSSIIEELSLGITSDHVANGYNDECIPLSNVNINK